MEEAEENDEPMMDDLAIIIALLVTAILIFYILRTNRTSSDTSQQEPTHTKQETISSGATGPKNLLPDDSDDEDDTDLLDEDFEEYLERVDNGLMNITNNKKDDFTQTQEGEALKTEGGDNDDFSCDIDMNLSATEQERLQAKMEDESTTTDDLKQESVQLSDSYVKVTTTGVSSDDNEEDSILPQENISVESEGNATPTDEGKEEEICSDETIQDVVPVAQESTHSEEEAGTFQSRDNYVKRTKTDTCSDESREDAEDVQMPQESDHAESKTEATSSDVSQEPDQLGGSHIEITVTEIPSVESTSVLLQEKYHEQKETAVSSDVDSSSTSPEAQIPTDHSTEKKVIPMAQDSIHAENEDEVKPTDLNPEYVRLSGSVIKRTWSVQPASSDEGAANETSLSGPKEKELNDNTEGCISAAEVSLCEVSDLKSNESPSEENEDHNESFCHETQAYVPQTEQNGSEVENVQADEYNGQDLTSQSAQLRVSLGEEKADDILE